MLDAASGVQTPGRPRIVKRIVEVMLGQGVFPQNHHRLPATMPTAQLQAALADLKRGIGAKLDQLPTHAEFLRRYAPVPA